jgi:hypothetical protein
MQCERKWVILCQRIRGSVSAIRARQNTRVFLTETRVVAHAPYYALNMSLIMPVFFSLPCRNIMVGSGGYAIGQYGPLCYWSILQHQIDDQLAFIVLSCPMVGRPAMMSNVRPSLVNYLMPEWPILQYWRSWTHCLLLLLFRLVRTVQPLPVT